MLATGKIVDEPITDYHSAEGAISHSRLKVFADSPLLYWKMYIKRSLQETADESSESLMLGSALGNMLEGGLAMLEQFFVVNREFKDFRTDKAKDWKLKMQLEGKQIVSTEMLAKVGAMFRSISENPAAAALLLGSGEPEVTFRLKLKHFYVQARTDRWHETPVELPDGEMFGPGIVELKTTASLDPTTFTCFQRAFHDFGYYRQAALYREVIATVMGMETLPPVLYVVVENNEPFRTAVFRPEAAALNLARLQITNQLRDLRDCYELDRWPDFSDGQTGIRSVGLAPWAMKMHLGALAEYKPLMLR